MAVRRPNRLDSEIKRPDGRKGCIHIERLILGVVQTNCYIIENEEQKQAVILDPADDADEIVLALQEKNLEPVAILLTHGHFDHGLAAEALKKQYHIPVIANMAEQELLSDARRTASYLVPGCTYTLAPDQLVQDGEELMLAGVCIRALHTPGHTIGSTCYYLPDYQVVFSGDTLFCGSVGRTDLPTGNGTALLHSLESVLLELPDSAMLLPGHGGSSTIELERKYNPYLDEGGFWQ